MKENKNVIVYNRYYDYMLHKKSNIVQLVTYYMRYRNFFIMQDGNKIKIGQLEMRVSYAMHETFMRFDTIGLKEFALKELNEVSTEEETLNYRSVCKTIRRIKDGSNR